MRPRLLPSIPALTGLLLGAPAFAAAQSPGERIALEQWRDSLAAATDTAALHLQETSLIELARRDRDNASLHLRLGFLAYRLGQLGGKPHFEDAAGEFEWAAELQPDWPYPWYGLGLAELALGEHAVIAFENLRQALGKDNLSRAARAFARAAEADPEFSAAVLDLASTALSQRISPRLQVAQAAARQSASSAAGRHPAIQLARGRVELELGEADSAVAAFRAALAVGADSGIALLELARSLYFARRPEEARTTWFAGVRAAGSVAAAAEYRADLAWIASPEELAAYDGLGNGAARAEWLERFWGDRDFAGARATGERLAEHYRRWFYARRNFRLVSRHRHYDITEIYRGDQSELDDRGVIYLRHGEPDARARYVCGLDRNCAPNESWIYYRPDGDLVFHFAARDDVQDFKLLGGLADVLGFSAAVNAAASRSTAVADLYASRNHFGPLYRRVGQGTDRTGVALAEERQLARRSIAVGTRSDSYARRYESSLRTVASEFVVGEGNGQALNVVFAIPADRLTPDPVSDGVRYPLHFRLLVANGAGRPVARLDTLRVFTAATALGRNQYLSGLLTVPVPAGAIEYRMTVESLDGQSGDLVVGAGLEAPALGGRQAAVSDLVLGRRGAGLVWNPAGDSMPLNPLGTWSPRGTVELYYEVHGLAAGTTYRTVVTLEREGGGSFLGRLFGGRRTPVLLEFDAVADGLVSRVRRSIELGDLARGRYRLTIRISDPAAGTTIERQGRLEVVGGA